jgi:molybdopterin molybdotransferase
MVSIEQACHIIASIPVQPQTEVVPLPDALGRILASDLTAPFMMPPFDKSAMDGYAIRSADPADSYRILATIAAGVVPTVQVEPGTCAKIMTGAMLPAGADQVVRVEYTRVEDGAMHIVQSEKSSNICPRGEDLQAGDLVLKAGCRVRPQEIAALAAMGQTHATVAARPVVGIFATGSELAEPGQPLGKGQIYNSNAHALAAQTAACGALPHILGVVADDPAAIEEALQGAAHIHDLLLFSGGVSAGDFDYVPGALKKFGYATHIEKIAIQPGMPTVLASRGGRFVFGLPGNPVSTFVIFEIFVRQLLMRMMGFAYQPLTLSLPLVNGYRRKAVDRTSYFPIQITARGAEALAYHGSAHIHALSQANGLGLIPAGEHAIAPGQPVYARFI